MKQLLLVKVLLGTAFVGCSNVSIATPLTLVKDGNPNATIVLRPSAQPRAQAAAEDLQLYIRKMTGVTLPLKADGKDAPGITLNIGKTDTSIDSDFPDKSLNPETYKITQRNDDVYFEGNYPSPTAFAVYSFLQDQLGIRWFAPGEDWEYVPQLKDKSTFTVDIKDVTSVPDRSPRVWGKQGADWPEWSLRNKAVQSEKVPMRNFQNFMFRIFPPSKYAKSHPEYYPLIGGKRWIPQNDKDQHWWPDIDNPDVKKITVQFINNYFDKYPGLDSVSLGMDDIWTRNSNFTAKKYYEFVNDVAREVKKTHPDRYIGILIYSFLVEPTPDIPKMEDNVFGYIAAGSSAWWFQPGMKEQWMKRTRGWHELVRHLSRYEYTGYGSFVPMYFPHTLAEAMKFDKSLGFEGMYTEVISFLPNTAPMIWAMAQLQWDSSKNIDALLNEFYTKMYPSSPELMKQYYDLLEKSWNTPRPGHNSGDYFRNIVAQAASISPDAVHEGMRLLEKAYNQAKSPVEKRRIDVVRGGLQFASYAVLEYDLGRKLSTFQITGKDDAEKGLAMAKEFTTLVSGRDSYWAEAKARDDLLGKSIIKMWTPASWPGAPTLLQADFGPIESPAVSGILRLMDWYAANDPKQAPRIAAQLTQGLPDGFVKNTLEASEWLASAEGSNAKSLLKNGNLEDNSPDNAEQQFDWETAGAPTNWSTWSSGGTGEFSFATGRNESKGFRVSGIAADKKPTRSDLLQVVGVEAGKRYLGIVWVKLGDPSYAAGTSLMLRFRDKNGWYNGEGEYQSATAAPTDKWQKIMIVATVPAGATAVTFHLEANKTAAVFDDAAFYKLP